MTQDATQRPRPPADDLPPLERLVEMMKILRGANGCPWDREQTPESITPHMVEEVYEFIEALAEGDVNAAKEELGDLLLLVIFQAQMAAEGGRFTIGDAAAGISEKLIRRHPHVFGDVEVKDSAEVVRNWSKIKQKKEGRKSVLEGVPKSLPALQLAQRTTEKASRAGFDWKSAEGVIHKVEEEIAEFRESLSSQDKVMMEHELGDLLFSLVNLSRHLSLDPEGALRKTVWRFVKRFEYIEQELSKRGKVPHDTPLEEMELLWEEAKKQESPSP
ncbi:MAG: nucleoside triphosphate pyrophosphohydrolase [Deltaproteobacteria bacterium]|nr:nucleoside triphosphate pyrophosphohydrolase [Deltaproteobacteria bacterium]